ncbi:Dipeptide-binding ABC transporter, periplasmic substrate-binding component (TC 3.A.1.5.2) [hydrothermal vent metagenome]|uniref:Dipeptide-binding ABC transporter, periplasmic substrate-binding component (TC 3.A.1.5.2) n=1 Tax=hydrothermal vent metagenome TaxID=652676 RepID=A0A3B1D2C3_9ZZZZ
MIYRLLVLLVIALPACHREAPVGQNTLVIAMESGPVLLDPRLATDAAASRIGDLLFAGLVQRGDNFSIAPDLAKKWETPDRKTYIFHLRDGVKFHNGKSLTARDVKAEYDFILDPKNKSPLKGTFKAIDKIEAPDELTVIFRLKTPSASFLGNLTVGIVPENTEAATMSPVGAGPFKFVEYDLDEKLVLARYEKFFDDPPKMESIVFRIIPDETVRTLELERGAAHMILNPVTPDLLPRFRKDKRLKVVTSVGTNYSYLGFNLEDRLTKNRAVREAVALAIDREGIIQHILKGLAKPATGPISPAIEFYEGNVAKYDHNTRKAKKILDDAGYTDPDGDGPQMRFTLKYSTSQNELRKRIAEVFQWQLGRAGIGLDIRSYEWGTFYADIKRGNFQLYSLTWVGIVDPDILRYIFHSASTPPDGANRGRYSNKRVDELTDMGDKTFGEERKKVYSEIQKIVADDLPYVSLWYSINVAVMDKRVMGFKLAPDENLKSLRNVWIEK